MRVAMQWQQKSIGYFYGFSGLGDMKNDPKYEIATAYP
jgi:sensor domain CHASE-containing protein